MIYHQEKSTTYLLKTYIFQIKKITKTINENLVILYTVLFQPLKRRRYFPTSQA